MLEIGEMRFLVSEKLLDSEILLKNHRTNACVYLAGYAMELALKLKISWIFDLKDGFPESKSEFSRYLQSAHSFSKLDGVIKEIRQIKNHDLNTLLFFSGSEVGVKRNKLEKWTMVSSWDPSLRYRTEIKGKEEAEYFLRSTKELIVYILKN